MPAVVWSNEYSVGVNEIDLQHKKMLELVHDLHSAVKSCAEKNVLQNLLVELVDFTHTHFLAEEQLMKEHDYPELKAHHKEHKMLIKHMSDLVVAVSSGQYPTFYSDYDVSTDWALLHISEHDKSLGAFLNTKGVF